MEAPIQSHANARVLVTGGTGFLGRHVVGALTKGGAEVHVAARLRRRHKICGVDAWIVRSAFPPVPAFAGMTTEKGLFFAVCEAILKENGHGRCLCRSVHQVPDDAHPRP